MKFNFELYLKTGVAEKEQWQQFFTSLTAHIGYMNQCQITVTIVGNMVRYFVTADRDLGVLSNNIDIGVLKPVKASECTPPRPRTAEHFVSLMNGGNFLDLREKMKVKHGKELEYIVLNCRRINVEKTYTKLQFYFKRPDGSYSLNKKTMLTFPAHLPCSPSQGELC